MSELGRRDNYMMQNPAQLHLHINRLNQKCKLQSEEILKPMITVQITKGQTLVLLKVLNCDQAVAIPSL